MTATTTTTTTTTTTNLKEIVRKAVQSKNVQNELSNALHFKKKKHEQSKITNLHRIISSTLSMVCNGKAINQLFYAYAKTKILQNQVICAR